MSGDVIETALSDAIRASDYGDQATQEGLTDFYDRAARAALSAVRDELADEALREAMARAQFDDGRLDNYPWDRVLPSIKEPFFHVTDIALSAVAAHFGGAK